MKNFKKICAGLSAFALTACTLTAFPASSFQTVSADAEDYYCYYDMESDTSSFSGRGSAEVSSSSDAYKGSICLTCSGRTAEWNGIQIPLDPSVFRAGEEYSISAVFKGKEDAEFKITLQHGSGNAADYDKVDQAYATAGSWVMLSNTNYRIPDGASDMYLIFETTDSSCDFSLDEVVLAKAGTKVDGPKGIKSVGDSKVKGDLDGDEKITVADFALLKSSIINGFQNRAAESNGDVDNSSVTNAEDAVNLQQYLLGVISEFPDNTPPEPPKAQYVYNSALSFKEAPGNYFNPCQQAGKITKETYNGINGSNTCNVYTPYGYDSSKKYNILYLMHGGSENENTIFYNDDAKMANMFDHMIMNGELEPLIVVCPTFNKCTAQTFYKEWLQSLIPFVEGKYSTYAASTSQADLKASRYHRAYGGFSMGSVSTWAGMVHGGLDVCAYWLPLSGDHWEGEGGYGKAKSVADAIHAAGLNQNEYFIMCATGSDDIAYPNVTPQIDEMKKMSEFVYTSDLSKGNFYYLVAQGKTHWWGYVRHYVYDILPSFFHEGQ